MVEHLLLEWMRENGYENQFVIMTDYESYSSAVAAIKKGAANYFPKSEMQGELFEFLNALWKGNEHIAKSREKIFARTSEAYTKVIELVNMFAPIQITVMILGESGTGKEHIARMIHEKSKRANKPFVTLDCGTLSEQLAASTLLGHEKGAFTGADNARMGVFEEAKGGTLFLDEIGNIPLHLQAKLLRVLQNRTITRVGDTKPRNVNIRLVCATNMDLRQKVQEGSCREDLFYRINTMSIHLPALRERPEDIVPLAEIFIKRFDEKYHREVEGIDPEAKAALKDCHWSGNIRELQNCIEKAVILAEGSNLTENELQLPSEALVEGSETSVATLEEVEEKAIRAAVEKYSGNMSLVAKALNVSRPTLYSKLKKYGI